MSKNRGWRKLMNRARFNARFVCPMCEKITENGKENLRAIGNYMDPTHWLWTCQHCGATHKDQRESVIK